MPAEDLAVGWLETRLPEEIAALHGLNRLVHEVIDEAFSPAVIGVGTTTALDVAWWLRQRLHDLGVEPWFQPSVACSGPACRYDERGARLPAVGYDAVIEPGDLVHCDVGLSSLGLRTDTQRNAYVLRPGETTPRPDCGRRCGRQPDAGPDDRGAHRGRTGNEVLAAARAAAAAEGIDADVYSHPVGFHGHGAGPAIGLWDEQGGIPGAGDYPVHPDTVYALELAVRVSGAGVGRAVRADGRRGRHRADPGGMEYLDGRQTELILILTGVARGRGCPRTRATLRSGVTSCGPSPSAWCSPSGWRRRAASSSSSCARRCRASWPA